MATAIEKYSEFKEEEVMMPEKMSKYLCLFLYT